MGAACCGETQPPPKRKLEQPKKKPIPKRKETEETPVSPNRRDYLYDYSKEPLW